MTKAELVEQVAQKLQLTQRQTDAVVTLFWQCIMDALEAGEHVELRGFGSFRVRARRARQGRNPKTGVLVAIPAKRVPWFKPGQDLCGRVNTRPHVPEAPMPRRPQGARAGVR
jgi:integration host factor subunit beta